MTARELSAIMQADDMYFVHIRQWFRISLVSSSSWLSCGVKGTQITCSHPICSTTSPLTLVMESPSPTSEDSGYNQILTLVIQEVITLYSSSTS